MRTTTRLVGLVLVAFCLTSVMLVIALEQSHSTLLHFGSFQRPKRKRADTQGFDECPSADMVYWREEGRMPSPFVASTASPKKQYVSFEYDQGGWNNIRMGMECVLAFALGSNRTVILPPASPLYLLNKNPSKSTHSFLDFFDLGAIETKFPGTFIEFNEFVRLEGPGLSAPQPSADCDVHCATAYLRAVASSRPLDAGSQCLVFRNSSERPPLDERIQGLCGVRTPVDFEPNAEKDLLIHFPMTQSARLLAHFYAFVMFPDTSFDRHVKRWMRDYMHYRAEIFCAAQPIVHALHNISSQYHALHIRRNDFQFKEAWLDMPQIAELIVDVIPEGSVVYISSDEKNKALFKPFDKYRVKFLQDFLDEGYLQDVNPNLYGMIEQIVASHADRFVGTWWSTFTGYINRMRGYRSVDTKSWYYPQQWKNEMQEFRSPDASGWWREWPVAWRNIDD